MKMISALFDDARQAQAAIDQLRRIGLSELRISAVAHGGCAGPNEDASDAPHYEDAHSDVQHDRGRAWNDITDRPLEFEEEDVEPTAEGRIGSLFGLAATAIPGAGPYYAAGWYAQSYAATTGSAIAATMRENRIPALVDCLRSHGYGLEDAERFGREVERGKVLVSVRLDEKEPAQVVEATLRHNGAVAYWA